MQDDAIRDLVVRLARPRREGGFVIERAAIVAAGPDAGAIEAWILSHAGRPEQIVAPASRLSGLHGGRLRTATSQAETPRRFLLPAEALEVDPPRLSITS